LKNLVGLNGNKDYLPHHRVGGTALGGDCYPGISPVKRLAEFCLDQANQQIGQSSQQKWYKILDKLLRLQSKVGDKEIEGGWFGNDTVWRMVLDLNRLLLYGQADGSIAKTPMRRIYSLTDAIIAGEGEGPLESKPVNLGIVTFASSSPYADLVHASLMGFDWQKIPCVREAFGSVMYPLTQSSPSACKINAQDRQMSLSEISTLYGQHFEPAQGWEGRIERHEVAV
jgi:hypothetical protein